MTTEGAPLAPMQPSTVASLCCREREKKKEPGSGTSRLPLSRPNLRQQGIEPRRAMAKEMHSLPRLLSLGTLWDPSSWVVLSYSQEGTRVQFFKTESMTCIREGDGALRMPPAHSSSAGGSATQVSINQEAEHTARHGVCALGPSRKQSL